MRIDKFLCDMNMGTRSQVKEFIKKGQVIVNNKLIKNADFKVNENSDEIYFQGKQVRYQLFMYYMLNKPKGVVSATRDNTAGTVVELLRNEDRKPDIFPVGRLDIQRDCFCLQMTVSLHIVCWLPKSM